MLFCAALAMGEFCHDSLDFSYASNSVGLKSLNCSGPRVGPWADPEPEIHIDVPASRPAETVFADFFGGPYYLDTPKGRFHIIVEPSLCMAFGSCETLAPKVFSVEKHKRVNPKAKVECETCAEYERIYAAAATCPTKAIKIIDRYTGDQLYP